MSLRWIKRYPTELHSNHLPILKGWKAYYKSCKSYRHLNKGFVKSGYYQWFSFYLKRDVFKLKSAQQMSPPLHQSILQRGHDRIQQRTDLHLVSFQNQISSWAEVKAQKHEQVPMKNPTQQMLQTYILKFDIPIILLKLKSKTRILELQS